jgi:hypothetical protein
LQSVWENVRFAGHLLVDAIDKCKRSIGADARNTNQKQEQLSDGSSSQKNNCTQKPDQTQPSPRHTAFGI